MAVVAARWCGTTIVACGSGGSFHIHWGGHCNSSNLYWSSCSIGLGLGGRCRPCCLGGRNAFVVHCHRQSILLIFSEGLSSRGQGTFKKLSKVPIPLGRVRLLARGHGEGKGPANRGEGG